MPCSGVIAWGSISLSEFAYLIRFPMPVVLRGFPARPRKLLTNNRFSKAGSLPCDPVNRFMGQVLAISRTKKMSITPINDSYWLVPGRLLAGEYPGAKTKDEARRKLQSFLDAKVDFFLDLTEEEEGLEPYAQLLEEEAMARDRRVIYRRLPIPDMDVPTTERMREIQQTIEA